MKYFLNKLCQLSKNSFRYTLWNILSEGTQSWKIFQSITKTCTRNTLRDIDPSCRIFQGVYCKYFFFATECLSSTAEKRVSVEGRVEHQTQGWFLVFTWFLVLNSIYLLISLLFDGVVEFTVIRIWAKVFVYLITKYDLSWVRGAGEYNGP